MSESVGTFPLQTSLIERVGGRVVQLPGYGWGWNWPSRLAENGGMEMLPHHQPYWDMALINLMTNESTTNA